MTKKSRQKFKDLENEKSFKDEIKSIFRHFKEISLRQMQYFLLEGETPTSISKTIIILRCMAIGEFFYDDSYIFTCMKDNLKSCHFST